MNGHDNKIEFYKILGRFNHISLLLFREDSIYSGKLFLFLVFSCYDHLINDHMCEHYTSTQTIGYKSKDISCILSLNVYMCFLHLGGPNSYFPFQNISFIC